MANRAANAGAHSAGAQRGLAAAPPPVHHHGLPRGRRAAPAATARPAAAGWLMYLIVLGGAAAGLFVAWQGSKHAGRGAGVVGGALLVAAAARLVLPPRCAGLLVSRGKALDVAVFAVLGAALIAFAVSLP